MLSYERSTYKTYYQPEFVSRMQKRAIETVYNVFNAAMKPEHVLVLTVWYSIFGIGPVRNIFTVVGVYHAKIKVGLAIKI